MNNVLNNLCAKYDKKIPNLKSIILSSLKPISNGGVTLSNIPYISDIYNLLNDKILIKYNASSWQAYVDTIKDKQVFGWAKLKNDISSQFISLSLNGRIIFENFLSNVFRPDLKRIGFTSPFYGFEVSIRNEIEEKSFYWICLHDPATSDIIAFKFFYIF